MATKKRTLTQRLVDETQDIPYDPKQLTDDERERLERLTEAESTEGGAQGRWKLTARQKAWAEAYAGVTHGGRGFGNATHSARLAGFSDDNRSGIMVAGHRMLSNANAMGYVAHLTARGRGGPNEVLRAIVSIATTTADAFVEVDPDGQPRVSLAKARDLGRLGSVKELVEESRTYDGKDGNPGYTDRTVKVKLYDRLDALKVLAKVHGKIVEKVEIDDKREASPGQSALSRIMRNPKAVALVRQLQTELAQQGEREAAAQPERN